MRTFDIVQIACVLKEICLKKAIDDACLTFNGNLLYSFGPATKYIDISHSLDKQSLQGALASYPLRQVDG